MWGSHLMDAGRYPDPAAIVRPAARGQHPHDDLDLAAVSDPIQRRGDGCGRARQLQRLERDQRALSDDDGERHVPLLRHVQRGGPDARLPAVVRSPDRKVRLGRDLGRQHRAPELSGGRERARRQHRARQGRLLHQRLPACNTTRRSTRAGARWDRTTSASTSSPAARSRASSATRRPAGRGTSTPPRASTPRRSRRASSFAISGMPYWTTDIGGYFGTPERGALHALVPVRGLQPDVPHPRTGAQGAVRLAVERARARPTCSPSTICATA